MALTEEEKKFYIDQGIKVGLVIFVASVIKDYLPGSKPGRVDRVPFDLEKTQNRYFVTDSTTDPPTFEVIPDPWTPADLANRLFTSMNGLNFLPGERYDLYKEVSRLGKDRARYLHNYWLSEIDPEDTLYRWIDGETGTIVYSGEVLQHLIDWGVGF